MHAHATGIHGHAELPKRPTKRAASPATRAPFPGVSWSVAPLLPPGKEPATVSVYLRLTVTDTLGMPVNGSHAVDPLAKMTRTFWYRLPADWVCSGRLDPDRRRR